MRPATRTKTQPNQRRGAALLEVIIAMTVLSVSGAALIGLLRGAARVVHVAESSEVEMRAANNFINAVSLWSRAELDQRLGSREQGPWILEITRTQATLYRIVLTDSLGKSAIVETVLFRRVTDAAQ